MTVSEKRKHDQIVRKLTLRIRDLSKKLRAAQAQGQNEVYHVREGANKMITGMRAATDNVKKVHLDFITVADSLEGVGYDALIAFGKALGYGFWGRLVWGVRFVVKGRV